MISLLTGFQQVALIFLRLSFPIFQRGGTQEIAEAPEEAGKEGFGQSWAEEACFFGPGLDSVAGRFRNTDSKCPESPQPQRVGAADPQAQELPPGSRPTFFLAGAPSSVQEA